MGCSSSYIGETGWTLQKRLVEHKAAVRRGDTNNGIAVHAWDHQHRVDWEKASVLSRNLDIGRGEYWRPLRSRDMLRTQTLIVDWHWTLSGLCFWLDLYHQHAPHIFIVCYPVIITLHPVYLSTVSQSSCHYLLLCICANSHYSWRKSTDQNVLYQLSTCYDKLNKLSKLVSCMCICGLLRCNTEFWLHQ